MNLGFSSLLLGIGRKGFLGRFSLEKVKQRDGRDMEEIGRAHV